MSAAAGDNDEELDGEILVGVVDCDCVAGGLSLKLKLEMEFDLEDISLSRGVGDAACVNRSAS